MMLSQFTSYKVADTGTEKSKKHFYRSATKEKGKCPTGKCCGKSECNWRVKAMDPFNLIQIRMNLFTGKIFFLCWEIVDEVFQSVQFRSINTGIGQTQRL